MKDEIKFVTLFDGSRITGALYAEIIEHVEARFWV